MSWGILLGRPMRAAVTVVSVFWFASIALMINRLFDEVVPVSATCLDESGMLFSSFLGGFIDITRTATEYWIPLIVLVPLVTVAPKQRFFALLPYMILVLVLVWQVLAAWASAELARVTVDCLVDTFVTNQGAGQ